MQAERQVSDSTWSIWFQHFSAPPQDKLQYFSEDPVVGLTAALVHVTRAVISAALISALASGTSAAQEPSETPQSHAARLRGCAAMARPAAGGSNSSPRAPRSIGVSVGVIDASWHYRQSGPAEADTSISLELPLNEVGTLKIELGTATWTFTREIARELLADDFTTTRLTLSYVGRTRPTSGLTILWRTGGGYYRLSSTTGDLSRHDRFGAHGGAGIERPVGGWFSVGGQAVYHIIPGRTLRLSTASISIHTLWLLSASVDLRIHF